MQIISESLIREIAVRVLAQIEDNIAKGIDKNGKRYAYSTNTFWRPYNTAIIRKLGGKAGEGQYYKITRSKAGKLGMLILGGYAAYKKKVNPEAADDFLTSSGRMLRDMKITSVTDTEAAIGFTDPEMAQRAWYLNVSGVGKSRKLWQFLDLGKEQIDQIGRQFQGRMAEDIKASLLKLIQSHSNT